MLAQMRDVLQEDDFVPQRDVIEEHEMLMNLSHIADVGHDWHAEYPAPAS